MVKVALAACALAALNGSGKRKELAEGLTLRQALLVLMLDIRKLTADSFAYVLYGLADFALGCSVPFLKITFGAIRSPLALHLFVVYRVTDILFDRPFCLIEFAFDLIFIR
jgi:hypothetical protein